MFEAFCAHLADKAFFSTGATIVVGYSGGTDSTCLLHLLQRSGFEVVAAHLNHRLRPDAEDEQTRCQNFCRDRGITFLTGSADVTRMSEELKVGIEEAGREARYGFLQRVCVATRASHIVTAHTLSDHVETMLFNWTRGTGPDGLAGIPERRDNIVRPLLPFTRHQTREYCRQEQLAFFDDPTNADQTRSRAYLRERVLPSLEVARQGSLQNMARTAEILREESDFLDRMAAHLLEQSEAPVGGGLDFLIRDVEASFEAERLSQAPPALLRRALRLLASAYGGDLDFDLTEALGMAVLKGGQGSVTAAGGDCVFDWGGGMLRVRRLEAAPEFRELLPCPGAVDDLQGNWTIEVHASPTLDELQATIGRAKVKGQLYMRNRQDGDRLLPSGHSKEHKLGDLMTEAKWPISLRNRIPVVCDMVGILWVPGVSIAARCEPTPGENTWTLALKPLTGGSDAPQ